MERQTSISTSLRGINISQLKQIQHSSEAKVSEKCVRKRKSVEDELLKDGEHAQKKSNLSNSTCQKQEIVEIVPPPVNAGTEELTSIEEGRCSVTESTSQKYWTTASRKVTVDSGNTVLKMWRLNSTTTMKNCYVFGSDISGTMKYVSVTGNGERLSFIESPVEPTSLNLDTNQERNDSRAFYFEKTSNQSEGILVPAMFNHLAAHLVKRGRRNIVVTQDRHNGGPIAKWIITPK